jgi:hypothetical protein
VGPTSTGATATRREARSLLVRARPQLVLLVGLLASAIGTAAGPAWAARVVDVRVGRHPDFVRVVFETDAATAFRLEAPGPEGEIRVRLDADSEPRVVDAPGAGASVRVEPLPDGGSLARIQADAPVRIESQVLDHPPRVVLDLRRAPTPAAAAGAGAPVAEEPVEPPPSLTTGSQPGEVAGAGIPSTGSQPGEVAAADTRSRAAEPGPVEEGPPATEIAKPTPQEVPPGASGAAEAPEASKAPPPVSAAPPAPAPSRPIEGIAAFQTLEDLGLDPSSLGIGAGAGVVLGVVLGLVFGLVVAGLRRRRTRTAAAALERLEAARAARGAEGAAGKPAPVAPVSAPAPEPASPPPTSAEPPASAPAAARGVPAEGPPSSLEREVAPELATDLLAMIQRLDERFTVVAAEVDGLREHAVRLETRTNAQGEELVAQRVALARIERALVRRPADRPRPPDPGARRAPQV